MGNKIYRTSTIRILMIIGNIFGLISGVFGLIGLIVLAWNIQELYPEIYTWEYNSTVFAVVGFFLVTNIFFCSYIINFIRKADDASLLNNRFIIALFSISIGGFFTPSVLVHLENSNVSSDMSAKFTISKGYGGNSLIAGASALIIYVVLSQFVFTFNSAFFPSGIVDQVVFGAFVLIFAWGFLNCVLFATPNAKEAWEQKGSLHGFMNVVAIINLIVATLAIIIQIIWAILSIITMIFDFVSASKDKGAFSRVLSGLYLSLMITCKIYIIYTLNKIIKGIWSADDKVSYTSYSKLAEKRKEYDANSARG